MNAPVSVEPDPAGTRSRARSTGRETAAMLIPLDADGRPRASDRTTGQLLLLSANQVTIAFDAPHPPCHGDALAIGVSEQPGCPAYASVVIRQVDQQVDGKRATRWQVHGRFGGPLQSLLQVGRFAPAFHTETLQYVVDYDESLLNDLCRVGIFRRALLDRVQVCPGCHSLPSVRQGCNQCESARFETDILIHHYACAWTAPARNFEQGAELTCPKCRTRRLVIGVDYEYVPGVRRCLDCGNQDFEPLWVGHCLRCRRRFPLEQAKAMEIHGYEGRLLAV